MRAKKDRIFLGVFIFMLLLVLVGLISFWHIGNKLTPEQEIINLAHGSGRTLGVYSLDINSQKIISYQENEPFKYLDGDAVTAKKFLLDYLDKIKKSQCQTWPEYRATFPSEFGQTNIRCGSLIISHRHPTIIYCIILNRRDGNYLTKQDELMDVILGKLHLWWNE